MVPADWLRKKMAQIFPMSHCYCGSFTSPIKAGSSRMRPRWCYNFNITLGPYSLHSKDYTHRISFHWYLLRLWSVLKGEKIYSWISFHFLNITHRLKDHIDYEIYRDLNRTILACLIYVTLCCLFDVFIAEGKLCHSVLKKWKLWWGFVNCIQTDERKFFLWGKLFDKSLTSPSRKT